VTDGVSPEVHTIWGMELSDIQSLQTQVLWAAFFVSVAFGAIAQRTHFCTMGAISDIVNMGDWTRMRMWGLAVGVAMIAFYAMAWLGWIDRRKPSMPAGVLSGCLRWWVALCLALEWCWPQAAAARRWCELVAVVSSRWWSSS